MLIFVPRGTQAPEGLPRKFIAFVEPTEVDATGFWMDDGQKFYHPSKTWRGTDDVPVYKQDVMSKGGFSTTYIPVALCV